MSETLIGVIFGGIIASIIPVVTLIYEHKKWKKGKRIENLRIKKEELEKKYEECKEKLYEGLQKEIYDTDMVFNFRSIFPKNVSEAFIKMMEDKDRSTESKKDHSILIIAEMKKSLAEIDKEIEKELK